jgi:cellulose biosynthesis protein BcsQ
MFTTFYSYKGGVGRSLALANIACLMAQDEEHPQRVLIWDFDLEAPGLHRLFPAKQPQTYGFVDLVYEYARSGDVPRVDDYIYESEIDGISVLPAGKIGESYCEKLQQINWLKFFGQDRTSPGPLFGKLVDAINERGKPFDYVLVDSRTGLNDQAGICTQVLSDLIVILFRLNAQNLDGLEHLGPAIKAQLKARNKADVRILPVASQVGAGSSRDLSDYRKKATRIFGKGLEYIRFDEGLVGSERLFCQLREMATMWPVPPIVEDYRRICSIIREQNENDTRTAVKQLMIRMYEVDSATAARMLLRLLPKRPRLHKLWTYLETLFDERMSKSMREDFKRAVSRILRADKTNYLAHEWTATFQSSEATDPSDPGLNKAKKSLLKAIEHAPRAEAGYIYRALARLESCQGNHKSAVTAMRKAQSLQPDNNQISLDLAALYMRMGEKYFAMAAEELDRVLHLHTYAHSWVR